MKNTPLIINWHDSTTPIYSAHFEPQGKGRLATGGGDNNVRLWKIEGEGEDRKVEYLSTLSKHTQAVNVVRWAPKGELLASGGDDGNVILWVPGDSAHAPLENKDLDDRETWRAKHMCRSSGAEIYDLAWSPDATYFIIGSMDNVARIYNAGTGSLVRQIAEHSHYVQGVAWDPLNEYIATQSSDRSVHIYSLKTKDGQYTLNSHDEKTTKIASHAKMDLPPRGRSISSSSPAPPDMSHRSLLAAVDAPSGSMGSPVPSTPGTPTSVPLPMNPPSAVSHSRRSSFSSRRSVSPAPSLPLPAVMSMEPSPKPHLGVKNANLYANETLTSFFRRLTFTPDGSLLMTPAGQYQIQHPNEGARTTYEVINTVYIYTRGGINKPPMAHLPGHKKPSIAVKCSPIIYTPRQGPHVTKHVTIDTSSSEDPIPALPEPISKPSPAPSVMDPPPPPTSAVASEPEKPTTPSRSLNLETGASTPGPKPTFLLPYRMIYAVATQDTVLLYDTQQMTPFCVVSNLHLTTFTDLAWSSDGLTLLISSFDGFCSTISFSPGELGDVYTGELVASKKESASAGAGTSSNQPTPTPTPTSFAPPSPFHGASHQHRNSTGSFAAPSPSFAAHSPPPTATASFVSMRPSSPARSNSTSSVATQASSAVMSNPTLIGGSVPSIAATNSGKVTGVPMTTPPETPRSGNNTAAGVKRDASESEKDESSSGNEPKKRRIAPTLISESK
ncbi:WD40-repeat-containing domain protein [Xylariales sp. AK1849]|nr:WD40-repeat-containing domain protein [Xylariales sp. AK1849]